jgi:hypothetical protein
MITINCSTNDEAEIIMEAIDLALSVSDFEKSVSIDDISINVNDEPYDEWGSFVNGMNMINALMK